MTMKKSVRRALAIVLVVASVVGMSMVTTSAAAKAAKSQATSTASCGQVETRGSNLNVRSGPGVSYKVVSKLAPGSYVILLSKSGNFWKVEYGAGKTGYVSSDYIKIVSTKTGTFNSSSNVNIRKGPSTSYAVLVQMSTKMTVCILSTTNGWHRILFNGTQTGYMSESFISVNNSVSVLGASASAPKFVSPVSNPNAKNGITPYKASNNRPFFEGHLGIDFNRLTANANYDVFAIYPGKVISTVTGLKGADKSAGYGNRVTIEHQLPNGKTFYSIYAHFEKVYVKTGQTVSAGQTLGKMGTTGNSTGIHLHIGVYTGYSTAPKASGGTMIDSYKASQGGHYHYDVREVIRRQDLW